MFPSYTHTTDLPQTLDAMIAERDSIRRFVANIGIPMLMLHPVNDAELLADVRTAVRRMTARARKLDRLIRGHGVQHGRQYVA